MGNSDKIPHVEARNSMHLRKTADSHGHDDDKDANE